jgi:hypothetical protein
MAERQTENHPGRDPEKLERYTLGRLREPERVAMDAHFRECAECRHQLEAELRLAAGVRHVARAQLKERIARRLSSPPLFAVPWSRITAMAATVLVIAGISVIGFWPHRNQVAQPEISPPPGSENVRGNAEAQAPPPATTAKKSLDLSTPARDREEAGKDLAKAEKSRSTVKEENEPRASHATGVSETGIQAAAPVPETGRGAISEGVWTEGVVSDQPAAGAAASRRDEEDKGRAVTDEVRSKAALKSAAQTVALEQQVILTQRPSRMLQREGQQSRGARKVIPTLARQVGDQLRLTLYPDTLFPANELRQATVLQEGEDSLTIQVGSQQIRYRLPSSLRQQRTAR